LLVNGNLNGSGLATVNSGAVVGGTGTIGSDLQVDGFVAPGTPGVSGGIGTLTAGNTTLNGIYTLDTDMSGGADKLAVNGLLTLGGSSQLDLTGLSLNATSTYTIASYTTLGGTFGAVDGDILATHTVDYSTGNQIRLVPNSTGVDGDYNGNGVVDAADYALWRKNVGQPKGTLPHDSSPDNPIGASQYNLWRANFGAGSPGSGSSLQAAAVPEPTSVVLIGMTGALLSLGWARKRTSL
jgi:hypothetical protein